MSNNGYFDLSTIFDIQKNHVVDLSNSYPHTDNASNIVSHVNELQNKLNSLSTQYDNANTASGAVLTEQRDMIDIVNTEHQRLLDKQAIIDEAQAEQERKALLNTTYRKKYAQYSKMTIVFCFTLLGVILLTLASRYFTIFPQSLYSFLTACLIAIGIIYILVLYADLSVRDNINYDEIVIPPPKLDSSGNLIGAKSSTPSIWDAFNKCKGSECCSPGTKWDDNLRLCIPELGGKSTPGALAPAPAPAPVQASTQARAPAPAPAPAQSDGFTTIHEAANYGEYYRKSILPSNINNNSKNYWMGSASNVKPNMDQRFNNFANVSTF
jgi:hypothetical protein